MTNSVAASYDEVIYPGNPVVQTQPDRLGAVATLFGMHPAPPSRCRVLELGCGIGGNLMSMACQWPNSEFVGIDISGRSIEIGNGNLAEIGIKNLVLRQFDIMNVTAEFGTFDYVIAHGVYSWVPPEVRERLLAVCKAHLAPQGVGYVSYNAYPGSHLRDIARDMMLFHTREIATPREKLEQGIAVLRAATEVIPEDVLHGRILRDQLNRIERTAEEVVYHDDLEPMATPFLLHEVAEAAARHGLQYLSDANFGRAWPTDLPEPAVKLIEQIPLNRPVEREQYIDFFEGRTFRRTLLCHEDVALDRAVGAASLRNLFFAGRVTPAEKGADPLAPGSVTFKAAVGEPITTEHPLSKAMLVQLGASWPQTVSLPELIQGAAQRLHRAGIALGEDQEAEIEAAANTLFGACTGGQVNVHSEPPPLTTSVSERPEASLLARKQIESGPMVINLRQARVSLDDPIARRFLTLVDGTRTLDQLVADLSAEIAAQTAVARGENAGGAPPAIEITREQVEDNLRILARLALLVR